MNEQNLQVWRRQRLHEMALREGGNSALGRKLGHGGGAFVGQMLRGMRPISEKTIFAIHKLPGYAGWFDASKAENSPAVIESTHAFAPSTSVPQALETIASALQQADDITLGPVKLLFNMLMDTPDRAPEIVPRIAALLTADAPVLGTETHHFAGKPRQHDPNPAA